jgi:transposase
MGRLDDITLEELQEVRAQTDGEKPRERVLAAIGRKQGDTLPRLAERHGVVEKTIRNWLDRFAEEPIEQAPYDEQRPGRPSKLEDKQRDQLFEHLQDSPTELGYEQQAWSTKLLLHTSKRHTVSSTVPVMHANSSVRPGCPTGQRGRVITKPI